MVAHHLVIEKLLTCPILSFSVSIIALKVKYVIDNELMMQILVLSYYVILASEDRIRWRKQIRDD